MGDPQPRLVDLRVAVEEEIEVERAGAAWRSAGTVAPQRALDLEQLPEELPRRQGRVQLDGAVQEPGLVDDPDGCGVATARAGCTGTWRPG